MATKGKTPVLRLGDRVYADTPVIRGEGIIVAVDVEHPDGYHPDANRPGVRVKVGSYAHPIFADYRQVRAL